MISLQRHNLKLQTLMSNQVSTPDFEEGSPPSYEDLVVSLTTYFGISLMVTNLLWEYHEETNYDHLNEDEDDVCYNCLFETWTRADTTLAKVFNKLVDMQDDMKKSIPIDVDEMQELIKKYHEKDKDTTKH